jgi:hypothetical protein
MAKSNTTRTAQFTQLAHKKIIASRDDVIQSRKPKVCMYVQSTGLRDGSFVKNKRHATTNKRAEHDDDPEDLLCMYVCMYIDDPTRDKQEASLKRRPHGGLDACEVALPIAR